MPNINLGKSSIVYEQQHSIVMQFFWRRELNNIIGLDYVPTLKKPFYD